MNKPNKRKVMNSLAELLLDDDQVLKFIKNLAQSQKYKSPKSFQHFCADCAIFYTSSMYIMNHKSKTMTTDELIDWEKAFIIKAENLIFQQ